MVELQRLRAEHRDAVLALERENRAWFAASVPDRGEDYFSAFDDRHRALLDEQETGAIHMHVLVDDDGAVVGRVNLVDVADGAAELGYRLAERATGRGLATWAVGEVCRLARTSYGLRRLVAVTTTDNASSRAVLERAGFEHAGETTVGEPPRPAITYVLDLGLAPALS